MTSTDDVSIVNARFRKLSSEIWALKDDERIRTFKEKIYEDEDDALQFLEGNLEEDIKIQLLHVAIDNRKNDFIVRVLEEFCLKPHVPDQTDHDSGSHDDQTDHDSGSHDDQIDTDSGSGPALLNTTNMLERAVLFATLNDDSETLEDILKWGEENQIQKNAGCTKLSPILYACLKDYTKCITVLYTHGYRISLPEEERIIIDEILMQDFAVENDYQYFHKLWAGNRHIDQFYRYVKGKPKRISGETDPVERLLSIRATANPHYIATEFMEKCGNKMMTEAEFRQYDPIRKTLTLARFSKFLSKVHPQYSKEYREISKKCEELATSILDHCDSMDVVKTILDYAPHDMNDYNNQNRNIHLALDAQQKSFVGHHYYQNFLWEKISGQNFHWDQFYLRWKIFYFPFSALLFLLIPIVVLLDAIFRNADIMFVSPEMLKQMAKSKKKVESTEDVTKDITDQEDIEAIEPSETRTESRFFAYFRQRMHRPILRLIAYHFFEALFLVFLALTLIDPMDEVSEERQKVDENGNVHFIQGKKTLRFYDWVTAVFILSYTLESLIELVRSRGQGFSSFWQMYDISKSFIMAVGGLIFAISFEMLDEKMGDNRADLSGNNAVNVGASLFVFGAILSLLKPLRWLLLNRSLGPLVVTIIKVLKDVLYIASIYLIFFVAYAVCFYFMFEPFKQIKNGKYKLHQDDLVTGRGVMSALFWRILDPGNIHYATILNNTGACKEKKNLNDQSEIDINCLSGEFSHVFSMAAWAIYQLITVILLLNLLIAMMNTTYTRIWEESDVQWKYSKSYYQIKFLFPRYILPSPFRSLYYLTKLIYWAKGETGEMSDGCGADYRTYKDTLLAILTVKLHSDDQIEDDFLNLRQDLQNHITDKRKISERKIREEFQSLKNAIDERSYEGRTKKGRSRLELDLKDSVTKETQLLREELLILKNVEIAGLHKKISELTDLIKTLINEKQSEA